MASERARRTKNRSQATLRAPGSGWAKFRPCCRGWSRRLWDSWEWYRGDGNHGKGVGCSRGACAIASPSHACSASALTVLLAALGYTGSHSLHTELRRACLQAYPLRVCSL
eukprot:366184-Chlamydomonas_euryale.AAC.6